MGYWLRTQAVAVGVFAVGLAVGTVAQSPAKPPAKADALLHSELSLVGRTASISFAPNLRASDAAYRGLFAGAGKMEGRVRIGKLQTNGALRLGDVSVGKPGATPLDFDLFLEAASDGWQLDIAAAAAPGGTADSTSLGKAA